MEKTIICSVPIPCFFAAGGYGVERWMKARGYAFRTVIVLLFVLPDLLLLPLVLPVFPINQTLSRIGLKCCTSVPYLGGSKNAPAYTGDYADMFGLGRDGAKSS